MNKKKEERSLDTVEYINALNALNGDPNGFFTMPC